MWSAGLKSPLREERNRSVREFDQATEPAGAKIDGGYRESESIFIFTGYRSFVSFSNPSIAPGCRRGWRHDAERKDDDDEGGEGDGVDAK